MAVDKNLVYIKELLEENGIRPSVARVRIYEYIQKNKNHPTVDTIYAALLPTLSTLSRTTVYNTLRLLVEKKVVQSIFIDEEQVRYDADISAHGHFKCLDCGTVYDFVMDQNANCTHNLEEGFKVAHSHLYSYGCCSHCPK